MKHFLSVRFFASLFSVVILSACTNATIKTTGKITNEMKSKQICVIAGQPSKEFAYESVRKIVYGKGSYGGVAEVIPHLANQARVLNADAVINYAGSQRFGFWPWRFVRPVVRGEAVRWTSNKDFQCEKSGGTLY